MNNNSKGPYKTLATVVSYVIIVIYLMGRKGKNSGKFYHLEFWNPRINPFRTLGAIYNIRQYK